MRTSAVSGRRGILGLIGRLGRDPETRYTKSGAPVVNFSIATDESWKDRSGNKQERTTWHDIVAWSAQAEFVQNYLRKGRLVYIEGRLQTRDWTDANNVKHYRTEIVANSVQGLDRPPEGTGAPQGGYSSGHSAGGEQGGYSGPPQGPPQGGQQPPQGQSPQGGGPQGPPQDEPYLEDDIPF